MKLREEGALFKSLLLLGLPIALQSFVSFAINITDVFMVQVLGEKELDACMIANIPCLIFYSLIFGVAGGACVLCSQYYGKGDTVAVKKMLALALDIMLVISLIFAITLFFKPLLVMSWLTNNNELVAIGASFLKIVAVTYVFMGILITYMLTIRSVGIVKISLFLEVLTLGINVLLNYVLIFGKLGIPAMGVKGAATATLISRGVTFLLGIYFMQFKEHKIEFRFQELFKIDIAHFKKFFKVSFSVILCEIMWGLGISLNSIVFSKGGAQEVIAAVSLMSMVMQLSVVAVTGFAASAEITIARLVGRGEKERAKQVARMLILISIIVGLISSGLTLLVRNPVVLRGNLSKEAQDLAIQLINIHAIVIIFQAVMSTCVSGVLRGGADTRTELVLNIVSMWCFAIPLAWVANYFWGWPVIAVYLCTRLDVFVKLVFVVFRLKGGKWIKNVTAAESTCCAGGRA